MQSRTCSVAERLKTIEHSSIRRWSSAPHAPRSSDSHAWRSAAGRHTLDVRTLTHRPSTRPIKGQHTGTFAMSASLAPECNEVKERYDGCFLKWYSEKFLRGTATSDECEPLFKQYKQCLTVRIPLLPGVFIFTTSTKASQAALKERGIDQMLEEARADNRENDAENMRPSCEFQTPILSKNNQLMRCKIA
ncbi:Mitochondrial distribution and morphology protein 35 [Zalaria obscura]|uniref:Mitochondrial distribution and morphology protein 35 n=1 Tax=Zalaria obscura TaxID=2024903 RepID=A0ACC3SNS0_9PEZI